MKNIKQKLAFIYIVSFIIFCVATAIFTNEYQYNDDHIKIENTIDTLQLKKDSLKNEMILSVQKYMDVQAPSAHDSISFYLVEHSINYDIDLCFMMSQTQIETNFGEWGAGRETSKRSLFGVGIYPGTKLKAYPNYDIAIETYCQLLKKSYLVKGRDEHFLMNNYINRSGNRYAVDSCYEVSLYRTYKHIIHKTNLNELQNEYNTCKSI